MPRNRTIEFDGLRMYFGEPYVIDLENARGSITVYSPTIGDVVTVGEKTFFQTLNCFTSNTTQYRLPLWDMGIDWTEISDFQLFVILYKQTNPEVVKLLFGDLDFQKFEPRAKHTINPDGTESDELVLWDEEDEIEINENVYNHFSQYLKNVFNIFPEEKITHDPILKKWYIEKDRRAIKNKEEKAEKNQEVPQSSMRAIISACINHPGFKYKLKELKEVGVCEFYDSVKRLQVYEQTTALLRGSYSGFVDTSKIKPENFNFMRDIK